MKRKAIKRLIGAATHNAILAASGLLAIAFCCSASFAAAPQKDANSLEWPSENRASDPGIDENQIKQLCSDLGSPKFATRERASTLLIESGFRCVPQLCEMLNQGNPEQRYRAADILVKIGIGKDEKQVAKMTRILHLLGTNGYPSLLVKAKQARSIWKQQRIEKTVEKITSLGGKVVGVGGQSGGMAMIEGGPIFIERGAIIRTFEKPSKVAKKATEQSRPASETQIQRLSKEQVLAKVNSILSASENEDASELRLLNLDPQRSPPGSPHSRKDFSVVGARDLDMFLSGAQVATQGFAITIDKNWKGKKADFKVMTDLPSVSSLSISEIELDREMFEVINRLSLSSLQLHRCSFDSKSVRAYAAKHPTVYLDVRGKALLGVRGPLAGVATIEPPSSPNRDAKPQKETCEITDVIANSAAQKAGVKVGDIVLAVDGNEIQSFQDLVYEIAGRKIGESVKVSIKRGDKKKELTLKLGDSSDPNVAVDD